MPITNAIFADSMRDLTGSAIRNIFHIINQPGMISFAGGMPASSALEPEIIAEIASDELKQRGTAILQYGATEGWPRLRESARDWLTRVGVDLPENQVLPVTGGLQGMDLLLKALINPGDTILVENPTFLGVLLTMQTYGANIRPVAMDENGIIPEALEDAIIRHKPKLLYVIPTFQNPTGRTLPLERRKAVAELAKKYQIVVAEDDPYRDLRYEGNSLPAIASLDHDGFVVYITSISKVISPGMRVGIVAAEPTLLRKMIIGKQATDLHTPSLTQAIVDGYLRRGILENHVKEVCVGYKAQLDAMLNALFAFPSGVTYTKPQGGLFVWVTLPKGIDAGELLSHAVKRSVAFVPGAPFHCDGSGSNALRLNFSNSPIEKIYQGMEQLNLLIRERV